MTTAPVTLVERLLARDPRAVARAISLIEDEAPEAATLLARIHPHTGRAYLIGVTGPPGAGKSTLVDRLIAELRHDGRTVAVIAVDPTSPYTGGAILGDRVRMQAHASDEGVFIRSMATRGHLGGLAHATGEVVNVLDAAGFDIVIVETVGVGQDEVDIVRMADVSIVMVVPGAGDDVQALKAGIMEIADIFVVNKADHEGADRTAASIEGMLSLEAPASGEWRPPVLRAVATTGAGVREILDAVAAFRAHAPETELTRRRARAEWRLKETLGRRFMQHLDAHVLATGEWDEVIAAITARRLDAYSAADQLLARATGGVLDHVGIAVADAAPLAAIFAHLFDLRTGDPEVVGLHRVRFVETGGTTLELVEPASAEAPVAAFLAKRGTALHHVCVRVPDVARALAVLVEKGVRLIDTTPRPGAHGSRIAFLHPSSTGGILVEIKEAKEPGSGGVQKLEQELPSSRAPELLS